MTAQILRVLGELISFDTVSDRSNALLIDYARQRLNDAGAHVDVVPSGREGKLGLWATIGPSVPGGVVLSGHTDVVPAAHQRWATNPFELVVKDDRAYGRGTADMKGFIAVALALAPSLGELARAGRLRRPIHTALTCDEEIGCVGAPSLIEWAVDNVPLPSAVFVGEPTSMRVVRANKGLMFCSTRIRGVEAHSSLTHKGVSAVGLAGQAITLLHRMGRGLARSAVDKAFDPPHTTLSANRIAGGAAVNIFAEHCEFDWDIRTVPGDDASEILQSFNERAERLIISHARCRHAAVSMETQVLADAPGLRPVSNNPAEHLALGLLEDSLVEVAAYAAEAGQYQSAGFPAVILGPGSIMRAHQPDEYIEIEQLQRCRRFVERIAQHLCGHG